MEQDREHEEAAAPARAADPAADLRAIDESDREAVALAQTAGAAYAHAG